VIVTGGTRGIGLALAEGYAAAGAKVVVASRKPEACKETAEHLRGMGAEALGVATHLGELAPLRTLVEQTVDAFGGVDVVVNNAANALALPHGEYTAEAWAVSLYAIGKAGLMEATRSMAAEFAPHGIRVNALSPGTVDTDMVRKNTPAQQAEMTKLQLMPRIAHADEMVGPALLLSSDAGSFITGQVVFADGGMVPR
jgi:NAD(P)-dependent dehydrogenase (short-subunit alcohol dehydrogenase family)